MANNNINKTHEFDKSESGLHKLFTCGGWNTSKEENKWKCGLEKSMLSIDFVLMILVIY